MVPERRDELDERALTVGYTVVANGVEKVAVKIVDDVAGPLVVVNVIMKLLSVPNTLDVPGVVVPAPAPNTKLGRPPPLAVWLKTVLLITKSTPFVIVSTSTVPSLPVTRKLCPPSGEMLSIVSIPVFPVAPVAPEDPDAPN